ncbi:MAG: methyltransferase type 12 [Deltaproteobacteria bacterium]|jgi:phospholipid N-methyltransferase|nr:methyltransferase type 12 [Deltaproteobacteria bacterium]
MRPDLIAQEPPILLDRLRAVRQDHPVDFFRGFLDRPKEVGSVIPSSRFLERRVVRAADLAEARVVVELGPGTGGSTRALLKAMPKAATLLAIEINPDFARLLREKNRDPRLVVHEGSAEQIREALAAHGLLGADVIVSGIPFSTMPPLLGRGIIEEVHAALSPGGRFVAYQVRDKVHELGVPVFGRARVQTELRNVPPMRVYRWERRAQL